MGEPDRDEASSRQGPAPSPDASPGEHRPARTWARLAARVALLVGVAAAGWLLLWSTVRPRAAYDTLWYVRIALEMRGEPTQQVTAGSWTVFAEYADPAQVAYVANLHGWPYTSPPPLWKGLYYERPVFPAVIALFAPALGDRAPLAASFVAVLVVTVVAGILMPPLAGGAVAAVFLAVSAANVSFSQWLIFLTTDGLAIAAWATCLVIAARFAAGGGRVWLVAFVGVATVLAFTRSMGVVLPLVVGAPAFAGLLARRSPWRRFVALGAAACVPLVLFAIAAAFAGWPSFTDMLQDLPTQHFHLAPVANPLPFLVGRAGSNLRAMIDTLAHDPAIGLWGALGVAGLILERRQPWTWPFAAALLFLPILQLLHPAITEAGRTLAPMWLSLDLGIAFVAGHSIGWLQRRWPVAATSDGRTSAT